MTALPEDRGRVQRAGARAARHVGWARTEGIGRLVEEDRLDPRDRLASAWRRHRWQRAHHPAPGSARVAFVFGLQRSGTNMVLREVEADPAVRVHNENDRRAFERYRLRDEEALDHLLGRTRSDLVLLKALCDSHDAVRLLERFRRPSGPARAVWVFRDVDGRAASAVAKFGDVNRRVLVEVAAGRGRDRWQAQRLSEDSLELVRSCDPAGLDAHSAAALFWVVRNRLFLELGLHQRPDVRLVSYRRVVEQPDVELGAVAAFLGLDAPTVPSRVDHRGTDAPRLRLDPRVRAAADPLAAQLDEIAAVGTRAPGPTCGPA